ncbi:hypothetical protein ACFQZI_16525 [Mucilaginibacter lutimaris]|uniref:Uncharacterized protein n=1 Tax=Mucilaginibacter lutimaris TaxID=931629 RepID=A0ABW2ZJX0_9SPHI
MQEEFNTPLPAGFKVPDSAESIKHTVETLFTRGTEAYAMLIKALTEENKDKYGSSEFEDLTFEIKRFDAATLKGRMRINYKLQLTFSCSAIVNNLNNQHSYWNFELNPSFNAAYFTGEDYGDLRSTADEF